jgi:hypothetical protein
MRRPRSLRRVQAAPERLGPPDRVLLAWSVGPVSGRSWVAVDALGDAIAELVKCGRVVRVTIRPDRRTE